MNFLQFYQAASNDSQMHDKASREYKNLFDLNIELNQDESLYEYLKETATMKGGEDEQIVLNSLIVKHTSVCYH